MTEPVPLVRSHDSMPIMAHRAARIVMLSDGTVRFRPMYASLRFAPTFLTELRAECYGRQMGHAFGPAHDAPYPYADRECACGIYAVPADVAADHPTTGGGYGTRMTVDLLVALYGTIVVHSAGYRASYQRVLECRLLPCRAYVPSRGKYCPNRVTSVGWTPNKKYPMWRLSSGACDFHSHATGTETVWPRERLAEMLAPVPVSDLTP